MNITISNTFSYYRFDFIGVDTLVPMNLDKLKKFDLLIARNKVFYGGIGPFYFVTSQISLALIKSIEKYTNIYNIKLVS